MTNATATAPSTTGRSLPSAPTLYGIGFVLGAIVIFAGNWDIQKGDNGGTQAAIVSSIVLCALTALLWFVVRPRVRNVERTVKILAIVGIVSIIAFWLGITPLLAAAAIAAGAGAGATPLSKTTRVLQVVAVVAAAVTVVGTLVQSNLF